MIQQYTQLLLTLSKVIIEYLRSIKVGWILLILLLAAKLKKCASILPNAFVDMYECFFNVA